VEATEVKRKRAALIPGTRVRLRAPDPGLSLRSDLGTIIGPDEYNGSLGYYIVRLDTPALYDHGGQVPETLDEVVELVDNMDVIAARQTGNVKASRAS
jgi:hypothetical protein